MISWGSLRLEAVYNACIRAEELDQADTGGDIPDCNTSRIYLLWKSIAEKGLPSQLPEELKRLLIDEL